MNATWLAPLAASSTCSFVNPYPANVTVFRPEFDINKIANVVMNWTDTGTDLSWWQASVCRNLTSPAPPTGSTCANKFGKLPASAVSGDLMEGGHCQSMAVWDSAAFAKTASFFLGFDGACGVRVFFRNGETDENCKAGDQVESVEYLLTCNPAATMPTLSDVEVMSNCHTQVVVQTATTCPYLPSFQGGGCAPYKPPTPPPSPRPPSPAPPGGSHYGDPKKGPCLKDEVVMQLSEGEFCSPACSDSNPPTCPSDCPAGSSATPMCAIHLQTEGYRCALICTPGLGSGSGSGDAVNDAQCGPGASCKADGSSGVCTYDDR